MIAGIGAIIHEHHGFKNLADQLGVDTPNMSAVNRLGSVRMNRDYLGEARRTMQSLGLSGYTVEQLKDIVA